MERPVIVFDLDGTILERRFLQSLSLYVFPFGNTGTIFPGVRDGLTRIAVKADMVALTARCAIARKKTINWIISHGLPFKEVMLSPFFLPSEAARVRFKRKKIREIKERGRRIILGVGDRGSDLEAYIEEGIFPVLIAPHPRGAKYSSLLKVIERKGLKQGRDYALFPQEGPDDPGFWDRATEWILERTALTAKA